MPERLEKEPIKSQARISASPEFKDEQVIRDFTLLFNLPNDKSVSCSLKATETEY